MAWLENFLQDASPRSETLVVRDAFLDDERRWFQYAVEKGIVSFQNCCPQCPRKKKRGESGADEFLVLAGYNKGLAIRSQVRHLFSLSHPVMLNREYIPHIAAYARAICDGSAKPRQASFSRYRRFSKNLIHRKAGGGFETDAEFYAPDGSIFLHIEAKRTAAETEKVHQGLRRSGKLSDAAVNVVKELEYVLDLKPAYLWVVGPGSIDPENGLYRVNVRDLEAKFTPIKTFPTQ